jgi:hypothetical protein
MESKTKLLDQMRLVLRLKHMSIRTEDTYVHWVRRFILFHHKRHPQEMGGPRFTPSWPISLSMTRWRLRPRTSR